MTGNHLGHLANQKCSICLSNARSGLRELVYYVRSEFMAGNAAWGGGAAHIHRNGGSRFGIWGTMESSLSVPEVHTQSCG